MSGQNRWGTWSKKSQVVREIETNWKIGKWFETKKHPIMFFLLFVLKN